MEFLKNILGEELYRQVETKVNEYNANSENKDKQVKIVDLSSGKYVSKEKYDTLQTTLNNANAEITTLKETRKKYSKWIWEL